MLAQEERYLVAQTKLGAECYAHDFLTGPYFRYEVFYPRVKTLVSHAGRKRIQLRPFLPRYLFIRNDSHVSIPVLRSAPGIATLMTSGGNVAYMRQADVDVIKKRQGPDGLIELDKPGDPGVFTYGERLKYNDASLGHSVTLDAIFQHKIGEKRALVFMDWVGRQVPIKVEIKQLERV